MDVSPGKPVLIDKSSNRPSRWTWTAPATAHAASSAASCKHIEERASTPADSACVIPPYSLPPATIEEIKRQTRGTGPRAERQGLMNVQFRDSVRHAAPDNGIERRHTERRTAAQRLGDHFTSSK